MGLLVGDSVFVDWSGPEFPCAVVEVSGNSIMLQDIEMERPAFDVFEREITAFEAPKHMSLQSLLLLRIRSLQVAFSHNSAGTAQAFSALMTTNLDAHISSGADVVEPRGV